MRTADRRSREIIDIMEDIVKSVTGNCTLVVPDFQGGFRRMACPQINYTFGNAQYLKDKLDDLGKVPNGDEMKFPLIALFCPFKETRGRKDCFSKAKVNVLIACSSKQQWSNEQRRKYSFEYILRPIYNSFIGAVRKDTRLTFDDDTVAHEYSENYSYGRYGAHTGTGDAVSEPIDAINITNLELTVRQINCRIQ